MASLPTITRVEDLIGSSLHPDTELFKQSLRDGAQDIIRKLRVVSPADAALFTKEAIVGTGGLSILDTVMHVVSVERNSYECRFVPANSRRQLDDVNSIYLAATTDPVYYIHNRRLFVKPNPISTQEATLFYIPEYEVTENGNDLVEFPSKYVEHLSIFAAIKQLQRFLSEKDTELPSGLTLPVEPSTPDLSQSSVSLTGTAPEYVQPLLVLPSVPVIDDLTIGTPPIVPPSLESVFTITYPTHPGYSAPALPSLDFVDANNWITDEEDTEMLNARISEINARISAYNADISSADKVYQAAKDSYQKEIDELSKNIEYRQTVDSTELQKYQSELTDYQNKVNTEVQQYQQTLTKTTQIWQQESSNAMQEYQANMTNNLNKFNQENTAYQADLQKDIQNAQLADSNEAKKLQKYQQELATYQAQLQKEVQNHQTAIQKLNIDYQWMQNQLAYLKQNYNEIFGMQMQPQGGERDGR
jgi:hypothetical protein